ncbi:MAG TPA: hypothetical protein VJN96_17760 [Vicinamibacterales bacterium]|nr:hypothetical protein [Vicinamibacterales bacterium]
MPKAAKRKPKEKPVGAWSATTIALIVLWILSTVGVAIAYLTRPPAAIKLTLVASNVAFDVAQGASQLLLSDADLDSFTVSGFDVLQPDTGGTGRGSIRAAGAAVPSLTVRPARLETVTVPAGTHVVVNWSADEPDAVRLTASRQPAHGSLRAVDGTVVSCHGCNPETPDPGIADIAWVGRATGGGTTILLRRQLQNPLRISQDDVAVDGALDTSDLAGSERVSTIKDGEITYLGVNRTEKLGVAARLVLDEIAPGTGRLKDLSVTKDGVRVTFEARVGKLGVMEAGQLTNKLPSWLELGFRNQTWLLLTQGVLLAGGTATKLFSFWRQRRGGDR